MDQPKVNQACLFNQEVIECYLEEKRAYGVAAVAIAKYRASLNRLLEWMQGEEYLTAEKLAAWRRELEKHGYSKLTVQGYVQVTNDFLRCTGHQEICIPKPLKNDLLGKTFGYLTVTASTGKSRRRDIVWHCKCKCGNEVDIPATLLMAGNTTSCGCRNVEILRCANRYVEGTSLRQTLENKPISKTAVSGYTGVQPKRGKWTAYINYKGVRYHLGTYSQIEDAVKARARAKELIMEDAAKLYEEYADCFDEMPRRPAPPERMVQTAQPPSETIARRIDNTSGCTGVTKQKGKWGASICVKKYRYRLGVYEKLEDAIAVRKRAEELVMEGNIDKLKEICTNWKRNTSSTGE